MNKKSIYRKVAKEYGVSVQEVKQEMQAALEHTYKNTPNDGITGAWQNKVPKKGEIPSFGVFLYVCSNAACISCFTSWTLTPYSFATFR